MGKATIKADIGDGQYTVELDHGQALYVAETATLDAKIAALNIEIAELLITIAEAERQLDLSLERLDVSIEDLRYAEDIVASMGTPEYTAAVDEARETLALAQEEYDTNPSDSTAHALFRAKNALAELLAPEQALADAKKDLEEKTAAVNDRRKELVELNVQMSRLTLAQASAVSRNAVLFDLYENEPETIDLWCADFNEGLTGEVGTIEMARQSGSDPYSNLPNEQSIIRPAGEDGTEAAYDSTTDGQMLPITMMTQAAAYVSLAHMPGASKWKPRYRTGVITDTDGDTCTVELNTQVHTKHRIDANQSETVICGFAYMNCNGAAFETGDDVVVAFEGLLWDNTVVVGFVTHPRACYTEKLSFLVFDQQIGGTAYIVSFDSLVTNTLYQHFYDLDENDNAISGRVPTHYHPYNVSLQGDRTVLVRPVQQRYDEIIYETDNGAEAKGYANSDSYLWAFQDGISIIKVFGLPTKTCDSGRRFKASSCGNSTNLFCVTREEEIVTYNTWWVPRGIAQEWYRYFADIPLGDQPAANFLNNNYWTEHITRRYTLDSTGTEISNEVMDVSYSYHGDIEPDGTHVWDGDLDEPFGMASNDNFVALLVFRSESLMTLRIYDTNFTLDNNVLGPVVRPFDTDGEPHPEFCLGDDYLAVFDPYTTLATFKLYTADTSVDFVANIDIDYVDPVPPDGGTLPVYLTEYGMGNDGKNIVLYVRNIYTGADKIEVQVYQWTVANIDTGNIRALGMVKRYEVEYNAGTVYFRFPYVGSSE